ncbi:MULTISPECIES: SagB family peptide dehydrogenase [Paenibacillus]|uniref:SagB family peptide dehydrogenase n=1 Tax=Paenibacillus TaxID=44249 RepID=UPI0022B9166E|nr:SagB family peptide dehydrogenase [Paenibacillus caseinilyticus]MCZ8523022.1 SagB family peptide dehydrogenase [Paenibacillus caseinilyticus]
MSLEAFIRELHADGHESGVPGWEVDWDDKPLSYKLYRGLPAVPLSSDIPLTLEARRTPAEPSLKDIGHFLWYAYGLTQVSHSYDAAVQSYRRFVPSGGGLYPNELYVYLRSAAGGPGVYHYDAAHHRLVLLREGDYDSYMARALGGRSDLSSCFGVVFVSAMVWKNAYKYNTFSYRLQGLDTGVLLGQLLETANRFGYSSRVHYRFLDSAVGHLLGLSGREENVYAVIPLSAQRDIPWIGDGSGAQVQVAADELYRELPAVQHQHFMRSRNVKEIPLLTLMNESAVLDTLPPFRRLEPSLRAESGMQSVYLPLVKRLGFDLGAASRTRYSPESEFVLSRVTAGQLAALLHEAAASFAYCNDLDGAGEASTQRVALYGCFYNVEGVPDGAYRYDTAARALRRVLAGDHRLRLQQGMILHNVNLFQVPICLHIAGAADHLIPELGYRGYRIQQMEAGMLLHHLLLASSVLGMGGRPLLGFRAGGCDEIYRLSQQGLTSLVQIPIGRCLPRPQLVGGLHG